MQISHRIATLVLAALVGLVCGAQAGEGLNIYYVRHAETVGNATGHYTHETEREFSEKGKEQLEGLVEKLEGYAFDHILVSPTWRTQQTILPYLKAHGRTAEIWPEFEEGGCGHEKVEPYEGELRTDRDVTFEDEEHFKFRDPSASRRYPKGGDYAQYLARIKNGCDLVKERFGGTGESILIVGHRCAGSRIFETFLGVEPMGRFGFVNTTVSQLRELPDGSFQLVMVNDKPFKKFSWRTEGGTRAFKPGDKAGLALYTNKSLPGPGRAAQLLWWVVDRDDAILQQGETRLVPRGPDMPMTRLEIETDGATEGEAWRLLSAVTMGGETLEAWEEALPFPTFRDLSGTWLIKAGDDKAWAGRDFEDAKWKWIDVPGNWEASALPEYDGIAWYRLRFEVTADDLERWGTEPLGLVMGAIDDADETYLNGTRIGWSGEFPPPS